MRRPTSIVVHNKQHPVEKLRARYRYELKQIGRRRRLLAVLGKTSRRGEAGVGAPAGVTVSVLVPYRPGCEWRERAWPFVRNHYATEHEGWELVEGDSARDEFSSGAAVADALERASGDVLVIADADMFMAPDVLNAAVRSIDDEHPWAVPHALVYRLSRQTTETLLDGGEPRRLQFARRPYRLNPGGGIVVVSRDAYAAVGGFDDRYVGWGHQDLSFAWALETLAGPGTRLDGDLWHLWHPQAALSPSSTSQALFARYKAAVHIPRRMRALVDHVDAAPVQALDEPVQFRATRSNREVRAAGLVVRFENHHFETTDPDLATALRHVRGVEEVG